MAVNKRGFYSPWGYMEENDYQSSENQFDGELDKLVATASYNSEDKKIHFFNKDGDELKDTAIDTSDFAGSVIESASYDKERKVLIIKFTNGDTVEVNFEELVDDTEFGDGFQVEDGIVSIKLNPDTEEFISVDENGVKISGVSDAIEDAVNAEKERALSAETALQEDINDIRSGSTTVLNELIEKLGYADNDTLVTNNPHEVAFGEWNISHTSEDASGQTIFSIGNGTSDADRSNALEVMKDGSVYLTIEGELMNINDLLGQLAHEVYD